VYHINIDNVIFEPKGKMPLVDKRKEVLRLYREILRTTRMFPHRNEQGQLWSDVLQKNARMEIEQNRYEAVSLGYTPRQHRNITVKTLMLYLRIVAFRTARPSPSAFSSAGSVCKRSRRR
jgi:hypothetical protein